MRQADPAEVMAKLGAPPRLLLARGRAEATVVEGVPRIVRERQAGG